MKRIAILALVLVFAFSGVSYAQSSTSEPGPMTKLGRGLLNILDAVVEVHNEVELEKALRLGNDVDIIGINHRNLDDFSIDLNITGKLLPKIPKDKVIIAESGIGSSLEVRQFKNLGANGILVGESLMRENDISKKINEFMEALK